MAEVARGGLGAPIGLSEAPVPGWYPRAAVTSLPDGLYPSTSSFLAIRSTPFPEEFD